MYGLAGRSNMEMAQADEIVGVVNDMIEKRIAAMRETDERKKSEMTREAMSEAIPATLVSTFCDYTFMEMTHPPLISAEA